MIVWMLFVFWGSKPAINPVEHWMSFQFMSEFECRSTLKTIAASRDIANKMIFVCREIELPTGTVK